MSEVEDRLELGLLIKCASGRVLAIVEKAELVSLIVLLDRTEEDVNLRLSLSVGGARARVWASPIQARIGSNQFPQRSINQSQPRSSSVRLRSTSYFDHHGL